MPRHACLLAQQAAEKAIKAVLVYQGVEFAKIHDLDRLRNLISEPASWSITEAPAKLAPLTIWAVEARYPGEGPDPEEADAVAAIATARMVVDRAEADLQRRGLTLTPRRGRRQPDPRHPQLPL